MSEEISLVREAKSKLPTLEELQYDVDVAFKNDQLNHLLNTAPPAAWLKSHPFINVKDDAGKSVPLKFMPVEKIEFLLTKIFQRWSVEIIATGVMFQSVYVHVRLKVTNPLNGLQMSNDGIGAAPIQTDAGASAADLSKIKNGAVMMALPSAESYAIKDAAEKFGRLFGKDLNRNNVIGDNAYSNMAERWLAELSEATRELQVATTVDQVLSIWEKHPDLHNNEQFIKEHYYYKVKLNK
jgi:hypothetical protein